MISQMDFVLAYFEARPNQDIAHSQSKREIEDLWLAETGQRLEDSDRAIRRLCQRGDLIKVGKGVYRLRGSNEIVLNLKFSDFARNQILSSLDFCCSICKVSIAEQELYVARIRSNESASIDNGTAYCAEDLLKRRLLESHESAQATLRQVSRLLEEHFDCPDWQLHAEKLVDAIIPCKSGLALDKLSL